MTEWITAVEASFRSDDLKTEIEKINRAKSCINYKFGSVSKIMITCSFGTWQELKETLIKITYKKGKQPVDEFREIKNRRYDGRSTLSNFVMIF